MALRLGPEWRRMPMSLAELNIDTVLRCGQSFRWRKLEDSWMCVLRGRIISLRQDPSNLYYRATWPAGESKKATDDDTEALLRHYFALHLDLPALYKQWGEADANFRRLAPGFGGVRMLSQDAWEALVCFICSSNNNIARISQMVHKLCLHYGPYIDTIDGVPFHDFPPPRSLTAPAIEPQLRDLGFGYRAKYIANTARTVALEHPSNWLNRLRNPRHPAYGAKAEDVNEAADYPSAHQALVSLHGVGPKVADCVCLMGLGWGGAIPVDTHVWQIATRDYKYGGSRAAKTKTLTKVMYDGVGEFFRELWGEYAGWAHSVLFTADLKSFAIEIKTRADADANAEVVEAKTNLTVEAVKAETDESGGGIAKTSTATTSTAAAIVAASSPRVSVKRELKIESQVKFEDDNVKLETPDDIKPTIELLGRPTPTAMMKREEVQAEDEALVKSKIKLEEPVPVLPTSRKRPLRGDTVKDEIEAEAQQVTAEMDSETTTNQELRRKRTRIQVKHENEDEVRVEAKRERTASLGVKAEVKTEADKTTSHSTSSSSRPRQTRTTRVKRETERETTTTANNESKRTVKAENHDVGLADDTPAEDEINMAATLIKAEDDKRNITHHTSISESVTRRRRQTRQR